MEQPNPQAEHQWRQRLIGNWTFESECQLGPDQAPLQTRGRESVRSLGGLWTIGEGAMETPGGESCQTIMTLGFDPQKQKFVGTFIVAVMTHLWPYIGSLDADSRILTLDSEGPSMNGDGTTALYQDLIEFISHDHRTLTSRQRTPDGQWQTFMVAHYRRQS